MQLQNNKDLTGGLPLYWNGSNSLLSVMVSNARNLGGSLPLSLFMLPQITYVIIEGSGISGSLPTQLCSSKSLKKLYVSGNNIHGPIPPCLSELQSLEELRASANDLEGPLPPALGSMSSLKVFDLSQVWLGWDGGSSHPLPSQSAQLASNNFLPKT